MKYKSHKIGGQIESEGNLKNGTVQGIQVKILPPARDYVTNEPLPAKFSVEIRRKIKQKDGTFLWGQPVSFRTTSPVQINRLIKNLQSAVNLMKKIKNPVGLWT